MSKFCHFPNGDFKKHVRPCISQAALASTDLAFHAAVYETLIDLGEAGQLLASGAPHLQVGGLYSVLPGASVHGLQIVHGGGGRAAAGLKALHLQVGSFEHAAWGSCA